METKDLELNKKIYDQMNEMGNVCRTDNDYPDKPNKIKTLEKETDDSTVELPQNNNDMLTANENINTESTILEKECDDKEPTKNGATILSEYLSGNYQRFFEVWDNSFSLDIKESIEYKILTLKLRVHYAILPIRIAQLKQHIDHRLSSSKHTSIIFDNVANKYIQIDNEKNSKDESYKLYADDMKRLEEFLNSCDGRKLTEELKDSPLITFFALPYLDRPEEDESVKKIFTIDWLEELSSELEKFVNKFFKDEDSTIDEELKSCANEVSENSVIETVLTVTDHKSKLTEAEGELIACNRIIHSAIKNKEIEEWISNFNHVEQNHSLSTKSTQTRISSLKTGIGFSMISEPHHFASLVTPSVFAIPSKQSVLYNDELSTTKTRLFSVHKHYRKLKLRFHKLHEDYQKMNDIAEVLTIALESSVQGKPVNLDMILQSCSKILPDRFHKLDTQTDSEDTSTEAKELSKNIVNSKSKEQKDKVVSLKMLDYEKIKVHLRNGDIKTKLLLLVALRQKLTSAEAENRDSIVRSYVNNDILGFKDNSSDDDENTILNYILMPVNSDALISYVQQTAARFLNALASLNSGRKYLTTGPIVLNAIIKYLDSCNNGTGDGITLDMLVATLQKMSLRKEQRNFMVEANLVEWLIYHLSNENFRMGTYRLEYTCALLMNLSLQSAARSRAAVIAPFFVSILTSLLSSDCVSILPYVNGALQNFLLDNEINEEAKKLHLAEILEYYCVKSGEELRNHFSHTLKVHKREYDANLSDDEFPDEDDEIFDVLEKELEEDDPVKFEKDELQGDSLLISHYSFYTSELEKVSTAREYKVTSTQTETPSHKESKSVTSNASNAAINVAGGETTADNSRTETTADTKSSTDAVKGHKKVVSSSKNETKFNDNEDESVFQAKPKIRRTPPLTARMQPNQEKVSKRAQSKLK